MYLRKVIRVAKFKDLPPGSMKTYRVLGRDILIVNVGGILYGLEAECPHRGYPLDLGGVEGRVLKCGFHYATFDVTSGEVLSKPVGTDDSTRPLRTYTIKVEGSDVVVEL